MFKIGIFLKNHRIGSNSMTIIVRTIHPSPSWLQLSSSRPAGYTLTYQSPCINLNLWEGVERGTSLKNILVVLSCLCKYLSYRNFYESDEITNFLKNILKVTFLKKKIELNIILYFPLISVIYFCYLLVLKYCF